MIITPLNQTQLRKKSENLKKRLKFLLDLHRINQATNKGAQKNLKMVTTPTKICKESRINKSPSKYNPKSRTMLVKKELRIFVNLEKKQEQQQTIKAKLKIPLLKYQLQVQ